VARVVKLLLAGMRLQDVIDNFNTLASEWYPTYVMGGEAVDKVV